jgi:hypothetical protein
MLPRKPQWLNIELDLQSLFEVCVHSCIIGWDPATTAFRLIDEGAIGQPRLDDKSSAFFKQVSTNDEKM